MSEKPESLQRQIAGNHYKGLAIEPFQFAMANDWDPVAFTILKRLSRYRNKDGRQDIEKALHEVDIRDQLWSENVRPRVAPNQRMTMETYLDANKITNGRVCMVLRSLESWVYNQDIADHCISHIKTNLQMLMDEYRRAADKAYEPAGGT
jgi:hypothetical protein